MTATPRRPSAWSAASRAWTDGFQAIDRMRNLALVAFSILILFEGVGIGFLYRWSAVSFGFGGILIPVVLAAFIAVALAPFAIAVHRFVLLGEVTPHYRLESGDQRLKRFAAYGVLLALLSQTPRLLFVMAVPVSPILGGFAACVLDIVVLVITLRVVILFPAVAVDAVQPTWRHATEDTKGHSWHVFLVLVLTSLPLILLGLVALLFLRPFVLAAIAGGGLHFGGANFLVAAGSAALMLITTTVFAAAASRLYRTLGASLG